MAGRMVGWPETKRQNRRGNCHYVMGRKEGWKVEWAPKKQVWGKAGLGVPPPSPTHASIAGSGTGEGAEEPGNQRLSFPSVTSDLPLSATLCFSKLMHRQGRQAGRQTNVFADLAHFLTSPDLNLNSIHRSFLRDEQVGNRHPYWLGHGAATQPDSPDRSSKASIPASALEGLGDMASC